MGDHRTAREAGAASRKADEMAASLNRTPPKGSQFVVMPNKLANLRAAELGFKRQIQIPKKVGFLTKSSPVFSGKMPRSGEKVLISPDSGGHRGHDAWKVFNSKLNRSTYNTSLTKKLSP
ncbi:MAG: hypothetical protein JKY48_01695 [Flavobacteriales bacterium]|nr:hypothetical protein [Flavobacteriales bacterium]